MTKKGGPKKGFARLLELAGMKKRFIIPAVILSSLASVASFIPYICIYRIVREVIPYYPDFSGMDSGAVAMWGWIAFAGITANVLLYFAALMLSHLAAFGTLYDLKVNFASYLARLPLGLHLNFGSGKLRKIMDENIEKIEGFIAHQMPDLVAALTAPVVMIAILMSVDWRFGLAALFAIVIAFVVQMSGYMGVGAVKMMNQYQAALEDMNNASVEYVRGISVVKAFRQTVYSFNRLHDSIQRYTSFVIPYTLEWENTMSLFTTIVNNVYLFIVPVGILVGMGLSGESLSGFVATFIFYLIFVPAVSSVMMKVMYSATNCRQIGSFVERMDDVLARKPLPEPVSPKAGKAGDVVFESVSFSYDGKEEVRALQDVSFVARQGKVTAVVGPSGGGKSTIAHLIPRFYDVTGGRIRIGGVDIRDMRIADLMNMVSFVFQDVFLFKQSLMDNIRIGNPAATDEQVYAAARAARCDEFIRRLPQGYETIYGREGVYLSGGEQQRVAIARAIVKEAPVLVLDEATAFADPENEHLIQAALSELMKGKTVIMIAHRLSTIRGANHIIVMDGGRRAEQGTHDELIQKNGRYRAMWDSYTQALNWRMGKEARADA